MVKTLEEVISGEYVARRAYSVLRLTCGEFEKAGIRDAYFLICFSKAFQAVAELSQ